MDTSPSAVATEREPLSRRRFLGRSVKVLSCAAAGTLLYTWRVEPHWVEVVEWPLPIAGLAPELAGKRLVQVSDLHAGPIVDQNYLMASLEGVAELRPDAIVVTGDFMTCDADESVGKAIEAMRALPSAPLGRLAILGNHDYGRYWQQEGAAGKLCSELEKLQIQALRNEVTSLGGLQIAGVDDLWTKNFQPEQTLRELATDRPALVLCHNPDGVDQPAFADYRGWILAGHTHGGQCKPPFMPPPIASVSNRRYVAGEYELTGGRRLYINRGLGYAHRVRFNARPEITVFTLQRA